MEADAKLRPSRFTPSSRCPRSEVVYTSELTLSPCPILSATSLGSIPAFAPGWRVSWANLRRSWWIRLSILTRVRALNSRSVNASSFTMGRRLIPLSDPEDKTGGMSNYLTGETAKTCVPRNRRYRNGVLSGLTGKIEKTRIWPGFRLLRTASFCATELQLRYL